MIHERLLSTIKRQMEKVNVKPLILWTTSDIIELLTLLRFDKFVGLVLNTHVDGFVLLCVASDWDCLLKLRKYMQDGSIQQLSQLSQIFIAESFYIRYYKE